MRPVSLVGGPLARMRNAACGNRVGATEFRMSVARRPSAVVDGGVAWWAETPTEVVKQLDVDPAPRQLLQAARPTAGRMAGAGRVNTRAAPSQVKAVARSTARRMGAASGASTRAAPSQSLKLQAACSARCV
jgi:hypothetical protein